MSQLLYDIFRDLEPSEFIEIRLVSNPDETGRKFVKQLFFNSVDEALNVCEDNNGRVHCYFGVGIRKTRKGTNDSIARVPALWVDCDFSEYESEEDALSAIYECAIPPSCVVLSGHGYHAYWLLETPCDPERASVVLKKLRDSVRGADATQDLARVMRVPGTLNIKDPDNPVECEIFIDKLEYRYAFEDIVRLLAMDGAVKRSIIHGIPIPGAKDKSRSGRDWHIGRALLSADVSREVVERIFETYACGDKAAESEGYLRRTLDKIIQSGGGSRERLDVTATFVEVEDCYARADSYKMVSTFVFEPERLIVGGDQEAFIGTIRSGGNVWRNVRLDKGAFSRIDRLLSQLPNLRWQWLGSDKEVRLLLPYLVEKWRAAGSRTVEAVSSVGRHQDVYVCEDYILTKDGIVPNEDAAIIFDNPGRVHPEIGFPEIAPSREDFISVLQLIRTFLPRINTEPVIWPIIGWFMAAPLKPLFRELPDVVRFPHLSLYGTKGSGKSSTILNIFLPLAGYVNSIAHSCSTTAYVLLSLLSSTTSVPVSLTEFRRSTIPTREFENLRRGLLMSYDAGRDSRGRANQTTQEYVLSAPIVLDGEDLIDDGAVQERTIFANLTTDTVTEGSLYYEAFMELVSLPLGWFAYEYLRWTLSIGVEELEDIWADAWSELKKAFPNVLEERIRRNLTVILCGLRLYEAFLREYLSDVKPVSAEVLSGALEEVHSARRGRAVLTIDSFVEDIVNCVAMGQADGRFMYKYESPTNILWFHLSSSVNWWHVARRQRNAPSLELAALKRQLREVMIGEVGEGKYIHPPRTVRAPDGNRSWMYGVDITLAHTIGLDVPERLERRTVVLNLPADKVG